MNNLILRTTNSPYGDINKGSVLAQSELDGNFVSLKGEVIYTCTTSNDLVTFTKYNGESFTFSIGTDCVFVTYSEFYNLITTSSLIPHQFYNITNFQTIFDVPDFYINGDAKGNYTGLMASTGLIEPIIVYTTSVDTIDSQAYQPAWPNDMIKYDWTFDTTEVTSTPAFGRITERIDSDGNRTDYDHRNVFFIRYETYERGVQLTGVITDIDGTTGFLKGFGTSFTSEIITSEPIIIDTKALFGYDVSINITTIVDDETLLFDYDLNIPISFAGESFTAYTAVHTGLFNSYKEFYIGQNTDGNYVGVPTFDYQATTNNYFGDFAKYKSSYGLTYLLSNNVLVNGSYSNKFGDRVGNNHFGGDDVVNNTFGNDMLGNVFYTGIRSNVIGNFFNYNTINSNFTDNTFGSMCENNTIGSSCIGNNIGNNFQANIIAENFQSNTIGDGFHQNQIGVDFYNNKIGNAFYENIIGFDIYGNTIGNSFYQNTIGYKFSNNTIGDEFYLNTIGNRFTNNVISIYFHENIIDDIFTTNQILTNFYGNTIIDGFRSNMVYSEVYNIDFSSAIYVYASFTCEIIGNQNGDNRLRYTDGADNLKYVAITD